MRAAITGASGLLGGNLAVELCNQGWEVVATRRGASKTAHLDAFGIEWVDASLDDTASLVRAFDGADVVFHCAAAVSIKLKVEPWIHEANVVGTDNVMAAVREVGARLVHCSSVVGIGLSLDGQPTTERNEWNLPQAGLADAYATTKYESQQNVRTAAAAGLDAVIVNPTYMIGPYDSKPSSGKLVREVVRGRLPGFPRGRNNFVDVRDVARGMVLAAQNGAAGEMYILGGHDMSYEAFIRLAAQIAGVKPPRFHVPVPLGTVVGWLGDVQEAITKAEPFLNSATIRWGNEDRYVFSSAKAQQRLGYQISPIEPAIEECLRWFREYGMV